MDDAARQTGPAQTPPALELDDLVLPSAAPVLRRADLTSLGLATLLHAAVLAVFLMPERRLGIGGLDANAIGVEIVTMAPALEARSAARGRGVAADRQVAEQDGDAEPQEERPAAPDSRRDEVPTPSAAAPAPADLAVPDWSEPTRPPDAPATDPVIARLRGEGTVADSQDQTRPTPDDKPSTAFSSQSATEVLARFRGGAAARGRETADTQSIVMPAARAGLRNEYQIELFKALIASQPRRPDGARGEVKVSFRVQRSGEIGEVNVVRSSGNARLDEAVVAAVRVARARPPPPGLDDAALWFEVPYTFK